MADRWNGQVERIREDGLERQMWAFRFEARMFRLVIGTYRHETRATKRHKWRLIETYSWIGDTGIARRLKLGDVPFPDDVQQEALTRFLAEITVGKEWA